MKEKNDDIKEEYCTLLHQMSLHYFTEGSNQRLHGTEVFLQPYFSLYIFVLINMQPLVVWLFVTPETSLGKDVH